MHDVNDWKRIQSISGLVAEYIVAIDVTRVRFPADAFLFSLFRFVPNLLLRAFEYSLITCGVFRGRGEMFVRSGDSAVGSA